MVLLKPDEFDSFGEKLYGFQLQIEDTCAGADFSYPPQRG
jgi:hypothetical protein